jgi:outer membrane lipoprotein-sorting protein
MTHYYFYLKNITNQVKRIYLITIIAFVIPAVAKAQTAEDLMKKIKEKLDKVNDYQASGKMKMNVPFIKAPVSTVKLYYKKPDKLKINNESGISLIPKGTMNINIGTMIANIAACDIIDAGKDDKTGLRIIKLLPKDENANIVLSTLYIDEKQLLVKKAKTTTKENGTHELEMTYGKYAAYGLADKVIFTFNTKEYKLPKGVAFDYDDGAKKQTPPQTGSDKKGTVEISYSEYIINKGVPDKVFQ